MKYKIVLIISIVLFLSSLGYANDNAKKKTQYPLYNNHLWIKHKIEQINFRNEVKLRKNNMGIDKNQKRRNQMKAIIISLLFCIAGVTITIAEIERLKKSRYTLLLIGSLLFFIAGFFVGAIFG